MEAYFRQAKNTEAERRACEIRLRAERKAGQLLAKMEKAKGGQPYQSGGTMGSQKIRGQRLGPGRRPGLEDHRPARRQAMDLYRERTGRDGA